jgi:hypothetical protein
MPVIEINDLEKGMGLKGRRELVGCGISEGCY